MEKVEKKIRDEKSIRILFIFDFVLVLAVLIPSYHFGFLSPITYIFLPILLICVSLQLVLYFVPKGRIRFDSSGITIITKNINTTVAWNDVRHIYYNSFADGFLLLNQYTIDLSIRIDGKMVELDSEIGEVIVNKAEYLRIISFIPRQLLEINDMMIYRNFIEKQNNKYHME